MSIQDEIDYSRIAKAIHYIRENFKAQPSLEEMAEQASLSPFHFQRLFTEWAGVSPKKFLQYISVEYAKSVLKGKQAGLFDAALETGLSGTGRLHDLFVNIEGMSPAEYREGGKNLEIVYSFLPGHFGNMFIASTSRGICHMAFVDFLQEGLNDLKAQFPNASVIEKYDLKHEEAISIFRKDWERPATIRLHLKGTSFQLKVWQALLGIPEGGLSTYGAIANSIGQSKASRAVGTAIGSNPVAFIIPCHRVIRSGGEIGEYMWGSDRKAALIAWEAAKYSGGVERD